MAKLKKGQVVLCHSEYGGNISIEGKFGVIRTLRGSHAGVEFFEELEMGHNLGEICEGQRGWYVLEDCLTPALLEENL
ncbi:hypothetical protein [Salinivibrio phage CW02]|uniref:Uncharacterized protein n=1 Tax=Salinivibrio phage CW02 TaxID=1161935 RepID=H9D1D1_9CAUD|nr:hypothetical protein F490_gp64 [Salinivibrio phage CW02]AFE86173.1 hypothetical protein [Salinivibrio phage CW02]